MCTAFASSSTTRTCAIACWVWCTASTSPCRDASRTTSPFRASTAISRCIPRCSDPMACPSKCRFAPSKCIAWRSPALPRTGSTNPAATPSAVLSMTARASGSRAWCKFRKAAAPRSSWRASRSICFRTRSTCSRRRARFCACRPAPPPWTLPTPSTRMSAIAASRPKWIAAWCRCARRCAMDKPWKSSRRRAPSRIRPGPASW